MKVVALQRMRRDTKANWLDKNPILPDGVLAYEKDTNQIKVGDGESTYAELGYVTTEPPVQELRWVNFPEEAETPGQPGDIAKSDTHLAVYIGDGTTHNWLTFMGAQL